MPAPLGLWCVRGTEGRGRKLCQREPGSQRWASFWCLLAWGFVELGFRGWKSINRHSGLVVGKRCFFFFLIHLYLYPRASLVAQLVKNLPAMQEIPVRFLGWEDPLEKVIGYPLQYSWASLVAQLVKNPPALGKTWIRSLGGEDPLEKGTAIHSSSLAWRIPWTLQSMGSQRVGHD